MDEYTTTRFGSNLGVGFLKICCNTYFLFWVFVFACNLFSMTRLLIRSLLSQCFLTILWLFHKWVKSKSVSLSAGFMYSFSYESTFAVFFWRRNINMTPGHRYRKIDLCVTLASHRFRKFVHQGFNTSLSRKFSSGYQGVVSLCSKHLLQMG